MFHLLFVLFFPITTIDGLYCAACTLITSPANCSTYQLCKPGDRCYTSTHGFGLDTYFDLGCRTESECLLTLSSGSVGVSTGQSQCDECCAIDHCNHKLCSNGTQDGGWSSWSQWSNCSHGRSKRTRTCNIPQPSLFGMDCVGINEDSVECKSAVAFTVTTPNRSLIDGRPIFINSIINVGGGYDHNTAKFTCPISGLYQFTFHVRSSGTYVVMCWIQKNGHKLINAETTAFENRDKASTSTYVQLIVGDVVSLGSCYQWEHVRAYVSVSFSGALIYT